MSATFAVYSDLTIWAISFTGVPKILSHVAIPEIWTVSFSVDQASSTCWMMVGVRIAYCFRSASVV